jgi:hypothetical protein
MYTHISFNKNMTEIQSTVDLLYIKRGHPYIGGKKKYIEVHRSLYICRQILEALSELGEGGPWGCRELWAKKRCQGVAVPESDGPWLWFKWWSLVGVDPGRGGPSE